MCNSSTAEEPSGLKCILDKVLSFFYYQSIFLAETNQHFKIKRFIIAVVELREPVYAMYEYEPHTVVEVIARCGVENKLQSFFPNKIFTHAPELSSTVRRVTTPLAGNITHTLRHALPTPFFQSLLISPPSFLHRGEFFSPDFPALYPAGSPAPPASSH